jgi:hypothetical protein
LNYQSRSGDDLASAGFDRIEVEFFSRPPALDYEPELTPLIAMPREARLAMQATLVLLLMAAIAMVALTLQVQLFMPTPEPVGDGVVQLPAAPEPQPISAQPVPRLTATLADPPATAPELPGRPAG